MGSISTPSGSLPSETYHYAHVNGVLSWREDAKSENFDQFSNALRNSFWTILSRMASTFGLVKIENYKGSGLRTFAETVHLSVFYDV